MDIIVIGLGSMGRRRIRLLKEYDRELNIVGVDSREDRRNQALSELEVHSFSSVEEACRLNHKIELAFVCTSPLSHALIIKECLERGLHVFSEINLRPDGYDENIRLAKERGVVLFLSSTFLYREEMKYLKKELQSIRGGFSYYHVGQYLPDWHPWENYKDFFVGNRATNGCRELMAIEFPWISDVFGQIESVKSIHSKCSALDIDFPDTYQLLISHKNKGTGMVMIDVLSRKAVRRLEVMSEERYISWDGTPEGLSVYNLEKKEDVRVPLYETIHSRSDYSPSIIENAYFSEIENFFDVVNGKAEPRYSFEKDLTTLQWIDKIEETSR